MYVRMLLLVLIMSSTDSTYSLNEKFLLEICISSQKVYTSTKDLILVKRTKLNQDSGSFHPQDKSALSESLNLGMVTFIL